MGDREDKDQSDGDGDGDGDEPDSGGSGSFNMRNLQDLASKLNLNVAANGVASAHGKQEFGDEVDAHERADRIASLPQFATNTGNVVSTPPHHASNHSRTSSS